MESTIYELARMEEKGRILEEDKQFERKFRFFIRPSADSCGTSADLLWEEIKNYRELAKESESFYRCGGRGESVDPSPSQHALGLVCVQDQWLHTAVIQQKSKANDLMDITRSNVVPRRAYLKRLGACISTATCPDHESCTRGFSEISDDQPCRLSSCTNCALVKRLDGVTDHVYAELVPLLEVTEAELGFVTDHPRIGEGGQGEVYKIYWRKGLFAKKTFSLEPEMQKEMEIAKEVSHPNVVHCFGHSRKEVVDHLAEKSLMCSLYMELLEESLESRIQERIQKEDPFSFEDIFSVLWQVADAMRELHKKRFIHGDLKPGNILLSRLRMPHSRSGRFYLVKVADFGCAQREPPEGFADPKSASFNAAVTMTTFNFKIGTTRYLAPEVRRGRRPGNSEPPPKHPRKIDVYSFGVVADEMLAVVKGGISDEGISKLKSLVEQCRDENPENRPSFSDICHTLERLPSEYRENRARSLEHGENGAHQLNKGHKGTWFAQLWRKLQL